jgi:ABC-2 type transport system permease protein
MMSLSVIRALVLRHIYLYARSPVRFVELIFWPVMELVVWGNVSLWLKQAEHGGVGAPQFMLYLVGGVILWDVIFRAQQGVAISFLEDVWTKNLVNIFVSPVRPFEYVMSGFIVGLLRIMVTVAVLTILGRVVYAFDLFVLDWNLVPFFGLLMMFGWSLGLLSSALIMRWGQAAESLAWAVPFFIQPVAAVFYPVAILPSWLQPFAWCLPCTPVFEGMRAVINGQPMEWSMLGLSLLTNLVWLAISCAVYLWVLKTGRERGMLTRVTSH